MKTTVVVIGAGQSGLAMSYWLGQRSIEHAVLERSEVAHTWSTERWDSLRLLTPNWQSRLPGYGYTGDDPDGFRTMPQTVALLQGYADAIAAPVRTHTTVTRVRHVGHGYEVVTDRGTWRCAAVVIASGAFNRPSLPPVAAAIPRSIATLTAMQYRNPDQLEPGGVMVVGASASGAQIADEIQRAGRPVTLAVGEHVRVPRTYRGRDILWWMDAAGILDERYDQVDDITRARNVASFQLAGYPDGRTIDLNALTEIGVKLVGRLAGVNGEGKAQLSGSLRNVCALADLKMNRLLNTLDEWAAGTGLDLELGPPLYRAQYPDHSIAYYSSDPGSRGFGNSASGGTGLDHMVTWRAGIRADRFGHIADVFLIAFERAHQDDDFQDTVFAVSIPIAVPEPSSWAPVGAGALALVGLGARRRRGAGSA